MSKLLLCMTYELLIETDGGPDLAISTLKNKLAKFAISLVITVENLIVIRGCPSLYYLNTVKRKTSVLNISLDNIALHMKPCQWMLDKVLSNNFSMIKCIPNQHIKLANTQCLIHSIVKSWKTKCILVKYLTHTFCLNHFSITKYIRNELSNLANIYCLLYSLVKPLINSNEFY